MTEYDIALASNYIEMRKQVSRIITDLDKGLEISPGSICSMFPWSETIPLVRPLLEQRVAECNAKLRELGIE